jgi:tartrate-resistant acid phosphatase type 5
MRKNIGLTLAGLFLLIFLAGRQAENAQASPAAASAPIRFAVIGDYGIAGSNEAAVAALVTGWNPDFIITLGDNNYENGSASTIDANIGQYYHSYIYPYTGSYGAGAATNKFFPSLGNHDWMTSNAQPYLNYFVLPGNERYYDFIKGPVHFFALDSDSHEPDGNTQNSTQGTWLKNNLAASTSPWNLVYLHHAPYSSSSSHGSNPALQWNYKGWGADLVMAGHDHTYERIVRNGFPYFVNGLGGAGIYSFGTPVSGSQVRYNAKHGAMLVEATDVKMTLRFYNTSGGLVDSYVMQSLFADVPNNYWALDWILRLYNAQITGGCNASPLKYCPSSSVTRAEMAVFLLRAKYGSAYTPPPATGSMFGDVPANHWAAAWIEQLVAEGITGGCGGGNYCPGVFVSRAQIAVMLLRAKHGSAYTPPAATGTVFDDVPATFWAAAWIEELAAEGIAGGCDSNSYCPGKIVLRDQMAVFIVKTFNLP